MKKVVTPAGGSPTTTIYIGDIYEITDGQAAKHIFAAGQRIAEVAGSNTRYFHADHLGSTSLMTDSAGAVVQTTRYTPFGNVYYSNGSLTDIGFTGHRLDASDGLVYARARYYDPALGKFITPDSIVPDLYDPQSLNRYAYVLNNPVNYTDPSGHASDKVDAIYLELTRFSDLAEQEREKQKRDEFMENMGMNNDPSDTIEDAWFQNAMEKTTFPRLSYQG